VESRSLTDQASRDEPPAGKPLAVFDGDGTLFRRGLLPELTRRLVDEGGFSERAREELSRDYYVWVERRGSYESYDNLVVEPVPEGSEGRLSGGHTQLCGDRGGGRPEVVVPGYYRSGIRLLKVGRIFCERW
jgi:hypothetical protein